MRLIRYFKNKGINQREFSEKHRFTYGYIRLIACGVKVPSLRMAIRISKATKGQVTPLDLLPKE